MSVCACVFMCAEGRSVASQIEIDGQDDGEKDDGSEDEDQDAILDDPAETERERERNREKQRETERDHAGFTEVVLCLQRKVKHVKQSHVYVQTK